jgi:rRNA processing
MQEIEERKQAKEAAIVKHRREKIQRHKFLAKRNYKGQPNMASRMELLLDQIIKKHQT